MTQAYSDKVKKIRVLPTGVEPRSYVRLLLGALGFFSLYPSMPVSLIEEHHIHFSMEIYVKKRMETFETKKAPTSEQQPAESSLGIRSQIS